MYEYSVSKLHNSYYLRKYLYTALIVVEIRDIAQCVDYFVHLLCCNSYKKLTTERIRKYSISRTSI